MIADVLTGIDRWHVETGDVITVLDVMPAESIHCAVTSPPYLGVRDYGLPPRDWPEVTYTPMTGCAEITVTAMACPLGLEPTPEAYIGHMVLVFRSLRRALRKDGTTWVNIGDSYCGSGVNDGTKNPGLNKAAARGDANKRPAAINRQSSLKPKDMMGIPWRLAMALQADGWWLRCDIIWAKTNPMPGSQTDRPTTAHEYVFLLAKSSHYFYDADAVREPVTGTANQRGRGVHPKAKDGKTERWQVKQNASFSAAVTNLVSDRQKRSVWTIATSPFKGAHFATYPVRLVEPCILSGTSARGCCPDCGAPWRRVTKAGYENPGNRTTNGPRSLAQRHETPGFAQRLKKVVETIGWEPGCKCAAGEPVPCIVLDPFNGAGTTGVASVRHGRRYVGIELNEAYADMARVRIENDRPLKPRKPRKERPYVSASQMALFPEMEEIP